MKKMCFKRATYLAGLLGMLVVTGSAGNSQEIPKGQTQRSLPSTRVTIEVTGGDKDGPIENASVYLKYEEERKIVRNKRFELNVKTNRVGIAHSGCAARQGAHPNSGGRMENLRAMVRHHGHEGANQDSPGASA
jgi:hypothetical protein